MDVLVTLGIINNDDGNDDNDYNDDDDDDDITRQLHSVLIKRPHSVFTHNFDTCQPIFIIFGRHTP